MGIIEEDQSGGQKELELLDAASWRTDRVNVLVYGDPGTGKTDFAARFPRPVILDTGENGQLTVKKMLAEGRLKQNVPIIRTKSFTHAFNLLNSPKDRLKQEFEGTKWADYDFQTLVLDNVSVVEEWCVEEVLAVKGKTDMDGPEINAVKRRMTALFRAAWNLDLNTVLIAHRYDGREATQMYKKKDKGPQLLGGLSKTGPAATDFFLYFTTEYNFGSGEEFIAYTTTNDTGYPARTRIRGILDDKLSNPSYEQLREALDKVDAAAAEA